jgi:hypothetical protein
MKVTESSKSSSAMDRSGKRFVASPGLGGVSVGGRRLGHRSEKLVFEQCSLEGCSHRATATVSSVWNPGNEWRVCDACQWIVDPDALGSDENTPSDGPWTEGSFHDFLSGEKEASSCVLQETTMSTKNNENRPLKETSCKYDEKAVVAAPTTWHKFEKVLSFRKLTGNRLKKCNMDGCTLGACSLWTIWKRNDASDILTRKMFYVCVDCQENKFGGWPTLSDLLGKGYMSEDKRDAITRRCSKQSHPIMPPAFVKGLA